MAAFEPVPPQHLAEVLSPYRSASTHVQRAAVRVPAPGQVELSADLTFADYPHRITERSLDAAEANIAYNQMLYLALGEAVARSLHPVFDGWTWADYRRKQLPNVLILAFRFERGQPAPRARERIEGHLLFESLERKRSLILVQSKARFIDPGGPESRCAVTVAIVDEAPAIAASPGAENA